MQARIIARFAIVAAVACALGCGQSTDTVADANPSSETVAADHNDAQAKESAVHNHGAWWCAEHGVPEEVCALCDSKLAAEYQRKGDWCTEHDRPDSQCFVCHPELKARFAAQYEAKFGEKPPKPEG